MPTPATFTLSDRQAPVVFELSDVAPLYELSDVAGPVVFELSDLPS